MVQKTVLAWDNFRFPSGPQSGSSRTEELMTLQKSGEARNDIGLSVSESKRLLNTVQQSVVQLQADEYTQHHIRCPHCLA
ncbi:hypothetical protein ACHBPN_22165, partial [Escherichia coli]